MPSKDSSAKTQESTLDIVRPPAPPSEGVNFFGMRMAPKAAKIVKGITATGLLGLAAWLLQNFLQLRGLVNLLASRIDLAFLVLCLFVFVWVLTVGARRAFTFRLVAGLLLVTSGVGIDYLVPRPQTISSEARKGELPSRAESEGKARGEPAIRIVIEYLRTDWGKPYNPRTLFMAYYLLNGTPSLSPVDLLAEIKLELVS